MQVSRSEWYAARELNAYIEGGGLKDWTGGQLLVYVLMEETSEGTSVREVGYTREGIQKLEAGPGKWMLVAGCKDKTSQYTVFRWLAHDLRPTHQPKPFRRPECRAK
ncbi:MAG: hypothetical protein ACYS7Y_34835 [Planctomycetota bacterium]